VPKSAIRCVDDAGGYPTIGGGIVFSAGVHKVIDTIVEKPAPDNHFIAGPDCRVPISAIRWVDDARSYPTIGGGIVFSAGVHKVIATIVEKPTPDNHLIAGPDCRGR
jgi:hypothetical protein